jgi:hypothetical protein
MTATLNILINFRENNSDLICTYTNFLKKIKNDNNTEFCCFEELNIVYLLIRIFDFVIKNALYV